MPHPIEMISKKLELLMALTDHLEGINPDTTPGCPYDLRDQVFRGRVVFGEETKPPFIAILEAPRQINPAGGGDSKLVQDEDWVLLIQGFVDENANHPSDEAYALLAWTQQRMSRITQQKPNGGDGGLYPLEYRLGGKLGKIEYQIPIVRPGKDDVSATAYFYMPVTIKMVTDLANPFVTGD